MSFVIVDDNAVLQIRGSIVTTAELNDLIAKLQGYGSYFNPEEKTSGTTRTVPDLHAVSTGSDGAGARVELSPEAPAQAQDAETGKDR